MALDDVIIRIGEFGKYQRRIYVLLCLPVIFCAAHKLAPGFINYAPPKGTCVEKNQSSIVPNPCQNFSGPIYHGSSTVTEWNLMDEEGENLISISNAIFMSGVMAGSIVFGGLSDKIGRKLVFTISLIIQLIGGVLVGLAPNYWSYAVAKAIVGTSISGIYLTAYVIATEMVGPSKRRIAGVCVQLFWTIGYVGVGILAFLFQDWRHLQYVITVPSIFFLVYWWFIPESARWLLTKGRVDEAMVILKCASKENGIELSRDATRQLLDVDSVKTDKTDESSQESSIIHYILNYPNIRNKTFFLCLLWIVISGTYYGLSWASSELQYGNRFLNHIVSGLIEVPVYIFLIFTLDKWGRKKLLCGSMLLSGFALIIVGLSLHYAYGSAILVSFMISKMGITSAYGVVYLFTSEQYPTVMRNMGLAACSTAARIGGIFAAFIQDLEKINGEKDPVVWLPYVTLGVATFITASIALLLPETLNKKLPETMKDGEELKE